MTTCEDVANLLTDYIEGELPPQDASLLKRHMDGCPACEAFLLSFKAASGATRNVLMQKIPADFDNRLQQFLRTRVARSG